MRAKKRYGQHFLQGAWADKVVTAIAPAAADTFIEIGPGPGALTTRLAPLVAHLTAIELDAEMVALLEPCLPANVTLVEQDFLKTDIGGLAGRTAVRIAGNLPYNVSSPILFRILDAHRRGVPIIDATLMLQREVADRIAAAPGGKHFGVLSIFIQLHADVRRVLSLPAGAFRPPPKVLSAVVRLTFRPPTVQIADERQFEAMVRSMFTQRRKTLANALRPYAESRGHRSVDALSAAGIDPARRPETLQLEELSGLADFFVSPERRAVL
ncbi:MAG: 16S rRNA (adenine(1518)-N(6)/adenine(1519)-N(6))-dimethyltransferase RsmA [Vicinamibacterales bacterium]